MIDFFPPPRTIKDVGREDRAMLGSNPSARTDGGTPTGASVFAEAPAHLSFQGCLAPKAINPCLLITATLRKTTSGVTYVKIFRAC